MMAATADTNTPTVVLVHGVFADGSSWNGVIERLQSEGVHVIAPANPLRGISTDSEYLTAVFAETPSPVLAVGHSYGGAVITSAAQRPVSERAFSEPNGPPAWRKLPSWTVVATGDKAAGADVIRSEAQRAGAHITEVEGSHVMMVSQPGAVADVILEAVEAVGET